MFTDLSQRKKHSENSVDRGKNIAKHSENSVDRGKNIAKHSENSVGRGKNIAKHSENSVGRGIKTLLSIQKTVWVVEKKHC